MGSKKHCIECGALFIWEQSPTGGGVRQYCDGCGSSDAVRKRHTQKTGSDKLRRDTLRKAAVAALGSRCVVCHNDDIRVLQIDHVLGGGAEERRRIGVQGMHRKILKDTAGYQLLCANCHAIKTYHSKGY